MEIRNSDKNKIKSIQFNLLEKTKKIKIFSKEFIDSINIAEKDVLFSRISDKSLKYL